MSGSEGSAVNKSPLSRPGIGGWPPEARLEASALAAALIGELNEVLDVTSHGRTQLQLDPTPSIISACIGSNFACGE
jgi:hypothetical protein